MPLETGQYEQMDALLRRYCAMAPKLDAKSEQLIAIQKLLEAALELIEDLPGGGRVDYSVRDEIREAAGELDNEISDASYEEEEHEDEEEEEEEENVGLGEEE
jgi:hypothetical protein